MGRVLAPALASLSPFSVAAERGPVAREGFADRAKNLLALVR
jgi:hypothetical protein